MGGVQLDLAAAQLGLTYGKEWCHIGPVPDEGLCALYNAADLYLTTSLGEGWGLGVTEAMACGCPVAMGPHTSLWEIGKGAKRHETLPGVVWLGLEDGFVCGADTRLRRRINLDFAVHEIEEQYGQGRIGHGARVLWEEGHLKTWDWVADRLFDLLIG